MLVFIDSSSPATSESFVTEISLSCSGLPVGKALVAAETTFSVSFAFVLTLLSARAAFTADMLLCMRSGSEDHGIAISNVGLILVRASPAGFSVTSTAWDFSDGSPLQGRYFSVSAIRDVIFVLFGCICIVLCRLLGLVLRGNISVWLPLFYFLRY